MKAVLCPVCSGKGIIYGIAETGAYPTTTCHGCNGKGWVEVQEDSKDWVYIIPQETSYQPNFWYPTVWPWPPTQY